MSNVDLLFFYHSRALNKDAFQWWFKLAIGYILQINSCGTHGAWRWRGLPYNEYPSDNREKTENQLKSPSRLSCTKNNRKKRWDVTRIQSWTRKLQKVATVRSVPMDGGFVRCQSWPHALLGQNELFSKECLFKCFGHAWFFQSSISRIRPVHSVIISRWFRLAGAGLSRFGSAHGWQIAEPLETAGVLCLPVLIITTTRYVCVRTRPGTERLGSLVLVCKSSSPPPLRRPPLGSLDECIRQRQ